MRSLFSIILIFFCLTLNNSQISNVLISIVLAALFLLSVGTGVFAEIKISVYILFFCFLVSGIIVLLSGVGNENILRYLCLMMLILSFPYDFNWNKKYLYYILLFAGIYLIFMQFGTALGLGGVQNFIYNNYPIKEDLWSEEASLLNNINEYTRGSFQRFGGVFYNPNIMGQIMVFWYVIMRNFSDEAQKFKTVVFLLALFSILLSGSRTAFLVFLIFNLMLYWPKFKKSGFFIVMAGMGVVLVFLLYSNQLEGLRIFNISQALTAKEGSGTIKLETFNRWIDAQFFPANFDWIKFLFGSLSWEILFDNDAGYMLSFFGFVGTFFFLYFLFDIYRHSTTAGRYNFTLLLVGIGATVIMNFRFSILLFLILSTGYKRFAGSQVPQLAI